ncbi:MAG: DUF2076 domain-containing protein [Acidobacteriota bacterium]|nr:DUF2076 domain-containing protein [Acidobacteriota bacterium]
MTPQERELLESLANRIASAPAPEKDREADDLIRQRIGSNPNALYILTQTVLIQDMALQQAKAQNQELQQRLAGSNEGQHTSFLGKLFGGGSEPPHAPAPAPPPAQAAGQRFGAPQYYPPAPPQAGGGTGSSFLRSAATTAAGVAAGALAFEGIQSLLGHHSGIGQGLMGGGFGDSVLGHSPGNEYVTNNYYDSPRDRDSETSNAGYDTASDDSTQDADDTRSDADYDTSADDSSGFGGNDDVSV